LLFFTVSSFFAEIFFMQKQLLTFFFLFAVVFSATAQDEAKYSLEFHYGPGYHPYRSLGRTNVQGRLDTWQPVIYPYRLALVRDQLNRNTGKRLSFDVELQGGFLYWGYRFSLPNGYSFEEGYYRDGVTGFGFTQLGVGLRYQFYEWKGILKPYLRLGVARVFVNPVNQEFGTTLTGFRSDVLPLANDTLRYYDRTEFLSRRNAWAVNVGGGFKLAGKRRVQLGVEAGAQYTLARQIAYHRISVESVQTGEQLAYFENLHSVDLLYARFVLSIVLSKYKD